LSETLPAHSPVGASTAKRMLACPLSVGPGVPGVEDDESEHAALGTAVHSLIEHCFTQRMDAWALVGTASASGGYIVTKSMANGAQVMLDAVRKFHPYRDQGNFFVEKKFHCPTIHPLFFGTCDALYIDAAERTLHVWDYKNGAGIIVEVEHNEQTMYYACGALEHFNLWTTVSKVSLHIVQPNGFHPEGRVRHWDTTPAALAEWLEETLIPGINRALTSNEAVSGPHCNFCPKRFGACPALMADMEELEGLMKQIEDVGGVEALTTNDIGRLLDLCKRADIVKAAALKTGYGRLMAGNPIPGWKLVAARANRVWKENAEIYAPLKFGEEAFTPKALKSPAQLEELPLGAAFTAEWAQSPDAGLTMAPASDKRREVSRDTKSLFTPVVPEAKSIPETPTLAPAKRRSRS